MTARLRSSTAAGLVPAAGAAFLLVLGTVVPVPASASVASASEVSVATAEVGAAATRQAPERWLHIKRTRTGYLMTAGLQDSRMRVTTVRRGLRVVDPGTAELREKVRSCREIDVRVGVGAICSVPGRYTKRRPLKLGIVPRLGHDLIDTSALSSRFDVSVLADAGRDVVRLGAGDDFVNGYKGVDRVWGGRGRDWIRTGLGDDVIRGGPGRDRLVGVEDHDVVRGGAGRDQVGGGPGRDRLFGGRGADSLACGPGRDHAHVDRSDTRRDCERLHR